MKVNAIANVQSYNNKKQPSFNAYVNGKYYADEVVKIAKKAKTDNTWKNKLMERKANYIDEFFNWHKAIEDQGGAKTRVLAGILTLGLSEVMMGTFTTIGTVIDNNQLEKMIKDVEDCIIDLQKDPNA